MKKAGILNAALAGALARLGHTDLVVIADCGLPIPRSVPVVDLALRFGVPTFAQTLDAVVEEIAIAGSIAATEVVDGNAPCWRLLLSRLDDVRLIPHDGLKELVQNAQFVIRTGEATPYANVILECGVAF